MSDISTRRILSVVTDGDGGPPLQETLSDVGVEVSVADDLTQTTPADTSPDCLVWTRPLDDRFDAVRASHPETPVVAVLPASSDAALAEALSAGADDAVRASTLTEHSELLAQRITGVADTTLDRLSVQSEAAGADPDGHVAEAIVENFPNGAVTLVDEHCTYGLAGGQLFDRLSVSPDDVIGEHVGASGSGDRERFVESYETALDGTETVAEVTVEGRTLVHRTVPVRGDDGTVTAAVGMTQDVTDRRARERELQRTSRAIEVAPVGITISDPHREDNPIIYANKRFHDVTGYSTEAVLGRNCRFLQGPDTDPDTVERIRTAVEQERPITAELRNYCRDGTEFWNHLEVAPVHDADGQLLNFVGFQRDVTDRVESNQALEESRNRYRTLVEHFPDGAVALVDTDLRYTTVGGTHIQQAEFTPDELEGRRVEAVLPEGVAQTVVSRYQDALDGESSVFESTVGDRTYRFQFVPVRADDGTVFAAMGVSQDVTEQRARQRTLEKRERILHELHVASGESYPLESEHEVAVFVTDFLENAFGFAYISVKWFDDEDGVLRPVRRSIPTDERGAVPGVVEPGDDPLWEAYRSGESVLADDATPRDDVGRLLATPTGDFGLILAGAGDEQTIDDVDRELIEVVATNAEAALRGLRREQERTALASELEAHQQTLAELRSVVATTQSIQDRITDSNSHEELETAVCEGLLDTERVDFAWMGSPQGADTDLTPTAWAGSAGEYLDTVVPQAESSLPARRAAASRTTQRVPNIAEHVRDGDWAKSALSAQFSAALSVPLVYDDVLYSVLTVYTESEAGFDTTHEGLVEDVSSLAVTYGRILEQRYPDGDHSYTELEFEVTDDAFALQRLATETDCRLRYDTVVETTGDTVLVLVTVESGDASAIVEWARRSHSVPDVHWFGGESSGQLTLTVERPFLATDVGKHGGELTAAVADPTGASLTVRLPQHVSTRPVLDALSNRFEGIDMTAQRHRTRHADRTTESLTDRQFEVLNAAYHGGYYEMPRRATGQALAEAFGISGPAVSKHLRQAHRKLVGDHLDEMS